MTSITVSDRAFWTTRRALGWVAALVLWTLLPPIAIGIVTTQLRQVYPEQNWREIGRVVALAVFTLGLAAGSWKLWRDYRRTIVIDGDEPWQQRANSKRLAVSGIWRDCMIAGFIAGIAGTVFATLPPGAPRAAVAAVTGVALCYAMVRGTVLYMRTIDEQERDANLWGGYCGMSTYAALYFAQHIAGRFGVTVSHAHDAIFLVALTVTGGVYLWKRFR